MKMYKVLKFIDKHEPTLFSAILNNLYRNDAVKANIDLSILEDERLIFRRRDKAGVFDVYELTIKGKEFLKLQKQTSFRFYLPIVIANAISIISLIVSFFF